jgi:hypothetical protein
MITVGIAAVAGLCYWFEWYQLALWILIYAIVYGVLDAVRTTVKASYIASGLWQPEQDRPSQDR